MKRIFLFLGLFLVSFYAQAAEEKAPLPISEPQQATVWRVFDGDSLRLSDDERLVLIGVDTPENALNRKLWNEARRTGRKMGNIKTAGKKALLYTRMLAEGKNIRIEYDEEKRDKRKHLLGYAYLPDGTFLNAELIGAGYARAVKTGVNTAHDEEFAQLEKEAKENGRGLWATLWKDEVLTVSKP